ncbi:hypothetical protein EPR50_G00194530 [Perca flavescens]|uniref:B30.2/SPRY domain-containing protein n=1 Tax=Perca flavescens TaxID=8167 RepID=A0A484C6G0_PERFV|nr:hypothetical protein EPR50_G00194530 [Perca flavescens]
MSKESTAPSIVSLKSERSKGYPLNFGVDESKRSQSSESTAPSVVSLKSERSKGHPLNFGVEKTQSELTGEPSSCAMCMEVLSDPVRLTCGHWACKQCVSSDNPCTKCGKKVRKDPGHQRDTEEDTRGSHLLNAKKNHRKAMQNKFTLTSEDACDLTWDPNTAHKNLLLSEGNRKVTWVKDEQPYPPHLERFDLCQQMLCEQGLDERCYWEVEVEEPFNIGLTYRSIGRKGDGRDCKLGHNDKSWALMCSDEGCFVQHSNDKVDVSSLCSRSSRLGVYLDWPVGTLIFYRVSSDSRTRLHTFKTTFNEPLYPAVELHTHSSAFFVG